jgi:hypothetical protein
VDVRSHLPCYNQQAPKANRAVIDLLARIGKQKGATPAQIALAWLLAQKLWIVPISGSRKLNCLDENIGAAAVELTPDDLGEIESAISRITVQVDRYPEELKKQCGRWVKRCILCLYLLKCDWVGTLIRALCLPAAALTLPVAAGEGNLLNINLSKIYCFSIVL